MGKSAPEPALRSLRVAAPAVVYEDRPHEQERISLLSRPAGGGPFAAERSAAVKGSSSSPSCPPHGDLEVGRVASHSTCSGTRTSDMSDDLDEDDDHAQRWQVTARFRPCRRLGRYRDSDESCSHRRGEHSGGGCVVELVQLNGANFGVRWRSSPLGRQAAPRWMVGPHWYLMVTTWSVFALLALFVTVVTLPMARLGETVTGVLLSAACLVCYALVGLSDPGIVPRISAPPDDSYTYCDQCESFRPDGALHCMDCRVCIAGYDHHCPWTGKCVGQGNARYFYAWLLLLVLAFVYEVIEFTTYMLPPTDQPIIDSSDDSFDVVMPSFPPALVS